MDALTLDIDGMSCEHCVRAVRRALEQVDGVRVDDVAIGTARVTYDPALASVEEIVDAVNDEGYSASRG